MDKRVSRDQGCGSSALVSHLLSTVVLVVISAMSLAALGALFAAPLEPGWLGAALACTSVAGFGWLLRDGAEPNRGEVVGMVLAGNLLALFALISGGADALLALGMALTAAGLLAIPTDRDGGNDASRRNSPWRSGTGIC